MSCAQSQMPAPIWAFPQSENRTHIKQLGYATAGRVRLYVGKLEVVSDPTSSSNGVVCSSDDEERPEYPLTTNSQWQDFRVRKGRRRLLWLPFALREV